MKYLDKINSENITSVDHNCKWYSQSNKQQIKVDLAVLDSSKALVIMYGMTHRIYKVT